MEQKNFQDLNLNNAILFSAALGDEETCRLILECILDCDITSLVVHTEYNILFSSDFKYIRLDVFGKDQLNISYDLEMQNKDEKDLPLRSRYYQSEIDLTSLKPGDDYKKLQPLFIIFVCSFDPFGKNLYRYTFEMQCQECNFPLNDGVKRIFLSTKGTNKPDVSPVLVDFLGYLEDSTDSYISQTNCEKIKKIHERVIRLKKDRNLEERYMRLEQEFQLQRQEGYQQGIEKGREEGVEDTLDKLFRLTTAMNQNDEGHLVNRLTTDRNFLDLKLKEYHI